MWPLLIPKLFMLEIYLLVTTRSQMHDSFLAYLASVRDAVVYANAWLKSKYISGIETKSSYKNSVSFSRIKVFQQTMFRLNAQI